jgi:3-methyl-2-oxobutanoate hydroxymethyltransferase
LPSMPNQRPTVADIRALKGKRQLTMMRTESIEEAEAADRAGIDMVSVPPDILVRPDFRDAAPHVFAVPGLDFFDVGTADDFVRWAFKMYKHTADAVYCSAGYETVRRMAADNIPVIGHTGLIPSRATWTGGFRAVGKTADSAMRIMESVRRYEEAGAFGAEIEVVPAEMAAVICKRTSLIMVGMGAGTGTDCQYLFATDVLGTNTGKVPRHSKQYRNFKAEYARLQEERVAAFKEFAADVESGAYPERKHIVEADPEEVRKFREMLGD